MMLFACGQGFTVPDQQQLPAANLSTKVTAVVEKGRGCTAASYSVCSCHDIEYKKYHSIKGEEVLIPRKYREEMTAD